MDLVIFEDSIKYGIWIKVVLILSVVLFIIHWITSYRSQIEIIREYRLKIRASPSQSDQFLEYAHKAFADWQNTHPA